MASRDEVDPERAAQFAWRLPDEAACDEEDDLVDADDGLRHFSSRERLVALRTVAQLSPDEARPRLLQAAADGAPEVAARARDLWFEHHGRFPATGELDGVPFLTAPAGERACTRLLILRGPPLAARRAIAAQLFAEAPDPEALALLAFAAADDRLYGGPGLPRGRKQLARALIEGFGAHPAASALAWLGERYPFGGHGGWLDAAATALLPDGKISAADAAPLRELAARLIAQEPFAADPAAFGILTATGGALPELFSRLLSIVRAGGPPPVLYGAALLLDRSCPADELARMVAALPPRDRERLERLFASPRK